MNKTLKVKQTVRLSALVLILSTGIMAAANALACTNPSAVEGTIIYNDTSNTPQFCNGTNWIALGGASTSGPSSNADTIDFIQVVASGANNGDVLTYDGIQWVGAAPASDALTLQGQNGAYYLDLANSTGTIPIANTAALTGDVTKTAGSSATTVVRLQGRDIAATAPNDGDVWTYNNSTSTWEPQAPSGGGGIFALNSATNVVYNTGDVATEDFVFGSTTLDNSGGEQNRMFFDKSKGAFRAGRATSSEWNDANVGIASTAFGYQVEASGENSVALGSASTASGLASTAMGNLSTASGFGSTAMGELTLAAARSSLAAGWDTHAGSYIETSYGRFSDNTSGSASTWIDTEVLFEIGNGADNSNRNNAITVLKNGNTTIDGDLSLTSSSYSGGTATLKLDNDSAAGESGCIRYDDTTDQLQFANDCESGPTWTALGGGGSLSFPIDADPSGILTQTGGVMITANSGADDVLSTAGTNNLFLGQQTRSGSFDDSLLGASGNTIIGEQAGNALVASIGNTALGFQALMSDTSTGANTAVGWLSLTSNTTGTNNTAVGLGVMRDNTVGGNNVAIGTNALWTNVGKSQNTAIGVEAMRYADSTATASAAQNTALGYQALRGSTTASNNTGDRNTAVGSRSMLSNTSGTQNVAVGYQTLYSNTTGIYNTAIGYDALYANITGNRNVANGYAALRDNTSGNDNVAMGYEALIFNTVGSFNTALGKESGRDWGNNGGANQYNVLLGYRAGYDNTISDVTGTDNVYLGREAGSAHTAGDDNILLGAGVNKVDAAGAAQVAGSDYLNIGNAIYGVLGSAAVGDDGANITIDGDLNVAGYLTNSHSASDGQALVWSASNSRWEPGTVSGGGGGGTTGLDNINKIQRDSLGNGSSETIAVGGLNGYYHITVSVGSAGGGNSGYVEGAVYGWAGGGPAYTSTLTGSSGLTLSANYVSSGNITFSITNATGLSQNLRGYYVVTHNLTDDYADGSGGGAGTDADTIDGVNVTATGANDGDVWTYNNSTSTWEPQAPSGGSSVFEDAGTVVRKTGTNAANNAHDFVFGSDSLDNDDAGTDDDARFFFDKSQGAFRAGYTFGNDWDNANIGQYSTAFGYNTRASANTAFAMGEGTQALAAGSTALGVNTMATGANSFVSGTFSTAGGITSTAMGNGTQANGQNSTSLGNTTVADGMNSTAMGLNTNAGSYAEVSMGAWPIANTVTSATTWDTSDVLFELGNGTSSGARSNAITVLKNGNVGIGTTTPATNLDISGSQFVTARLTTSDPTVGDTGLVLRGRAPADTNALGYIDFINLEDSSSGGGSASARILSYRQGNNDGADLRFATRNTVGAAAEHMRITSTGNVGIGTTTPNVALDVDGDIEYTGILTDVSDRRLKENLVALDADGRLIDKLMDIKTYSFNMIDEDVLEYGVVAQEMEEIFPSLVRTADDEMGTKSVNYVGLIPVLIASVQEQQEEIDALRAENEDLRARVEAIEAFIEAQKAE